MVFRGSPSVQPGLSVTFRECVVLRSVVLGAPALHSQPRQDAATLSPQTLPPLALRPPSHPAGFSHPGHSLGKGGPWSPLSHPCLGSSGPCAGLEEEWTRTASRVFSFLHPERGHHCCQQARGVSRNISAAITRT